MACATADFTIQQGSTFSTVLRWETGPVVYKAVSAVPSKAPLRLTVTGHGLVTGWRIALAGLGGMTELNITSKMPKATEYYQVTVIDVNTIELNDINGVDFGTYTSGGYIQYNTPTDLTGYTARLKIRSSKSSTTVILSLTDVSGITISNVTKTITVTMTPTQTAAFTFVTAVYDLELVSNTGPVTRLIEGKLTLDKEVTY